MGGIFSVGLACQALIFLNEKYESTSETRNYNIGGDVKSKIAYGLGISCFVLSAISFGIFAHQLNKSISHEQKEWKLKINIFIKYYYTYDKNRLIKEKK